MQLKMSRWARLKYKLGLGPEYPAQGQSALLEYDRLVNREHKLQKLHIKAQRQAQHKSSLRSVADYHSKLLS